MSQVPVKWAIDGYLMDTPPGPGSKATPVVPLSALREVVEGLKVIGKETYCDGPGCGWCESGNRHPFTENAKAAQRLLASLGEK